MNLIALEQQILASRKKGHRFKLNSQGLARGDKDLMSCLLPDNGKTIVSVDCSQLEPTVISHYTKDPVYKYAAFEGVGKEPYYASDGVLMIDDMYLMSASKWPIFEDLMRSAFNRKWGELTFTEQWLKDNEVIKGALKKQFRAVVKAMVLALGYGAGWKKLRAMAYEHGFIISAAEAKEMHRQFWNTYRYMGAFARHCAERVKEHGCIVNDFGYRLTPEPHKAFNAVIQSSASGVLDLLQINFFDICKHIDRRKDARGLIHDELLFDVPKEFEAECRQDMQRAVDRLNEQLQWDVPIRTGWQSGDNHFVIH